MNAFALLNRCPKYTFVILESSSCIDRVPFFESGVEHLFVKCLMGAPSPFACALLRLYQCQARSACGGRVAERLSTKLCKLPVFDETQNRGVVTAIIKRFLAILAKEKNLRKATF